jgi:hypothetical protein
MKILGAAPPSDLGRYVDTSLLEKAFGR